MDPCSLSNCWWWAMAARHGTPQRYAACGSRTSRDGVDSCYLSRTRRTYPDRGTGTRGQTARGQRRETTISRRPKRYASIECAPGPSNASAAASPIRKIAEPMSTAWPPGAEPCITTLSDALSATATAHTGVSSPATTAAPLTRPSPATTHVSASGPVAPASESPPWSIDPTPTTTRSSSRPAPGQLPGNVEKDRCRFAPDAAFEPPRPRVAPAGRRRIPRLRHVPLLLSG